MARPVAEVRAWVGPGEPAEVLYCGNAPGLVAGVVILEIAASVIGEGTESMGPPGIDLSAALAGVVVLVLGGLFAGMIPAQRAVAISPVDALRS